MVSLLSYSVGQRNMWASQLQGETIDPISQEREELRIIPPESTVRPIRVLEQLQK